MITTSSVWAISGQAAVQFAGRQGHDPERERRLRRHPRVHGRQI